MGCCEVKSVFETVIYLASMGVHVLEMLGPITRGSYSQSRGGYGSGSH